MPDLSHTYMLEEGGKPLIVDLSPPEVEGSFEVHVSIEEIVGSNATVKVSLWSIGRIGLELKDMPY